MAENTLQISEPDAEDLFEFQLDAEGRLSGVNAAAASSLGYLPEEMAGRPLTDFLAVAFSERAGLDLTKLRGAGASRGLMPLAHRDGSTRVWAYRSSPRGEGEESHVRARALDITGEACERLFSFTEGDYRQLFEHAHDAIIIFAPEDEVVLDVNRRACELYGYSRDEFVGKSLVELSADVEQGRQHIRQTLERGWEHAFETVQYTSDGRRIVVEVDASVATYRGRRVILSINRDATGNRRAAALEAGQRRFLEMVATGRPLADVMNFLCGFVEEQSGEALCATFILDEERAALRLGAAPSLPQSYREAFDNLRHASTLGAMGEALVSGEIVVVEDIGASPLYGELGLVMREAGLRAATAVPVSGAGGDVQGVLVLYYREPRGPGAYDLRLIEVSRHLLGIAVERERVQEAVRRSEAQLRLAQKLEAVGRLAGGVAHEYNNLLAVIIMHTDLLLLRQKEGDPARLRVTEIREAADRAASLTHQLLAFSRRQVLQPQLLDLNSVIKPLKQVLRSTLGAEIELEIRLAPSLGRVKADTGQLQQALLNLVTNSRDAMTRGGRLVISTEETLLDAETDQALLEELGVRPGPYVLLTVRDTGSGMDEETRAHIFEPFYTTKGVGRGTGLGLPAVYGIVAQSEGGIRVLSSPGAGTTVQVYLPRAEDEPAAPPVDLAGMPQGHETVLVVEDERMVRDAARQVLELCGYTILEAVDGAEALELGRVHEGPIHLLLADLVMPKLGGAELASRLKSSFPALKVIYMSGHTEDDVLSRVDSDAEVVLLHKPFTLDSLCRRVRDVLDGAGTS